MKINIKHIQDYSRLTFLEDLAKALTGKHGKIIDIQYSTTSDLAHDVILYSALIIYEEEDDR